MALRSLLPVVALLAATPLATPPARAVVLGQAVEFIINDRDSDSIWRLHDDNGNGVIDGADEFTLFFSALNIEGTTGPMNPTSLAVGPGRRVLIGDQVNQCVYLLRDLNDDGDAQDDDESIVFADQTNVSGASFAFPTGAAFDRAGVAYITNAGNASGPDAVYRLTDLTADGDANDTDEIILYVDFGGNGPYSPQEILLDGQLPNPDCYLRNSSAGLQGVFIQQASSSGPGGGPPFFDFFTALNASGIVPSAGFTLEPDRDPAFQLPFPWSMYTLQLAAGGVDQLIRCRQITLDGDANDMGEARIVYSTAAAGFTSVDAASLPDGDVLITDASADQIIRLHDLAPADGDFLDAGESSIFFANGTGVILDIRQIAIYRLACPPDLDGDGLVGSSDLALLLGGWGSPTGDQDDDGNVGSSDLALLLGGWGPCPVP